jgi:hypothetical protein
MTVFSLLLLIYRFIRDSGDGRPEAGALYSFKSKTARKQAG